jgi:hypothetical protein
MFTTFHSGFPKASRNVAPPYHGTGGQKVTKPMVAKRLSDARNRITTDILDSVWCIYLPEWDEDQQRKEVETNDPEYRHVISLDDLRDLSETNKHFMANIIFD